MTEIFVDTILTGPKLEIGVSSFEKTVANNLNTIYAKNKVDYIYLLIEENKKDGVYTFDKYEQFVVQIDYRHNLGLNLKFMDFKNDDNVALAEINDLKQYNWKKQDLDKIMELHFEIKNSNKRNAILVNLKSFEKI